MAEDIRYQLYDTAIWGSSLAGEQTLFSVAAGSDSTHTKDFTNARGAGALPQGEKFEIDWIGVFLDEKPTIPDDVVNVWRKSYLEIRVADLTYLLAPLRIFAAHNQFSGHFSQATAADKLLGGLMGSGYKLDIPILVPGGSAFKVVVNQGVALSTASQQVKIVLDGILSRG